MVPALKPSLLFLALFAAPGFAGKTVFVDANLQSGANDGSSWSDAFRGELGLQAALGSLAPGVQNEVWIADGRYLPGPASGGIHATFMLADKLKLYGGFAGGESTLAERDPALHIAELSGDLNNDDVEGPLFWQNDSENAIHVVTSVDSSSATVLDGLTVRRGNGSDNVSDPNREGSGLRLINASTQVVNCVFRDGVSGAGGAGVYALHGAPTFTNCRFENNRCDGFGAGAWIDVETTATFTDCVFIGNKGSTGTGLYFGAYKNWIAAPITTFGTLRGCLFQDNTGPFGSPTGMGFYAAFSNLSVTECTFIGNRSQGGAGGAMVQDSEAVFHNCDFVNNEGAGDGGGALYVSANATGTSTMRVFDSRFVGNSGAVVSAFGGLAEMTNCTFVANDNSFALTQWPAFLATQQATIKLANSIVRDHSEGNDPSFGKQYLSFQSSSITANDCCLEFWDGSLVGSGNFDADPLFVDADGVDNLRGTLDDDLRLTLGSPCLDRSNHAWRLASSALDSLDLAGTPRFIDRPASADIGPSCAPVADLGAFEVPADGPWIDLGFAHGQTPCRPHLAANGTLQPGAPLTFNLVAGPASAPGYLILGTSALNLPLLGGTLVPEPTSWVSFPTDAAGTAQLGFNWFSGTPIIPAGIQIFTQTWHFDGAAVLWSASNAQQGVTP